MHYAVVITPNDSKKSSTLVVIPLTSLKSADKVNHLHFGEIFLGSELLQKLLNKTQSTKSDELIKEIAKLKWAALPLPIRLSQSVNCGFTIQSTQILRSTASV